MNELGGREEAITRRREGGRRKKITLTDNAIHIQHCVVAGVSCVSTLLGDIDD